MLRSDSETASWVLIQMESNPMNDFSEFIDYCLSFYGPGGLYDQGRTKEQIAYATTLYLDAIAHYDCDTYTWGDGDSLDRERVRDIMNEVY